mmetsp:Transcript_24962/g.27633  ORF Transcript_24962/g.27633 Transcript_24962/m.27633 type:complete len:166 (+) Transcript_24962:529-1026(+)
MSTYSVRKDVVSKTIFRSIRKFFVKDFKSYFNFTKCCKSSNSESSGCLSEKLREYISIKFPESNLDEMTVLLACIIDAKERYCTISDEYQEKKEEIRNLLNSYNKKKLQSLYKYSEFLSLVIYFIDQPNILLSIVKGRSNSKLVKEYQRQMKAIKASCIHAHSSI